MTMKMNVNVCPGTLKSGYSTYSPSCISKLFNGIKVNHILPYDTGSKNEDDTKLFIANRKRISISGVQEKLSLLIDNKRLRLTGRKPYCRISKILIFGKKDMTREEFAKLADAKYDEINALKKKPTLLDYEQGFVDIWQELGREIIQVDLGSSSTDRRKKRSSNPPSASSK